MQKIRLALLLSVLTLSVKANDAVVPAAASTEVAASDNSQPAADLAPADDSTTLVDAGKATGAFLLSLGTLEGLKSALANFKNLSWKSKALVLAAAAAAGALGYFGYQKLTQDDANNNG